MHLRYKEALDELGKRYDELLEERNILTSKLGEARLGGHVTEQEGENKIQELYQTINNLNSQLSETL